MMYQFKKETILKHFEKDVNIQLFKFASKLADSQSFVCGGIWRSMFDHSKPNDIDIYFQSEGAKTLVSKFLSDTGWHGNQAYPHVMEFTRKSIKVQLMTMDYYENVENTLSRFDWNCCRIGCDDKFFYMDKACLKDLKKKELSIHYIQDPLSILRRVAKYSRYGYKITNDNSYILSTAIQQNFKGPIEEFMEQFEVKENVMQQNYTGPRIVRINTKGNVGLGGQGISGTTGVSGPIGPSGFSGNSQPPIKIKPQVVTGQPVPATPPKNFFQPLMDALEDADGFDFGS